MSAFKLSFLNRDLFDKQNNIKNLESLVNDKIENKGNNSKTIKNLNQRIVNLKNRVSSIEIEIKDLKSQKTQINNGFDKMKSLPLSELKDIYFKTFLTSSPYSGINGTKLVVIGMINILKTPIENTKVVLYIFFLFFLLRILINIKITFGLLKVLKNKF